MTDTAKCAGVSCPIRDGCDRFVRPAVDGQRWIEPRWIDLPSGDLDYPQPLVSKCSCYDWQRVPTSIYTVAWVEPHGGAAEEVDGS